MGLKKVGVLAALGLGLLLAAAAPEAQRPKVPRIGFLSQHAGPSRQIEAFRQGLRELGYVEGENITIVYRAAGGAAERLPELAAELVRLNVDLIVTTSSSVTRAAKRATSTIPIVMAVSHDPVGHGLVASLDRPGGNVTGLTTDSPGLDGKRLEILKEAFPKLSRLAVFWSPLDPLAAKRVEELRRVALLLDVELQSFEVRAPDDLQPAFRTAVGGHAEALMTLDDPFPLFERTRFVTFAGQFRLPVICAGKGAVKAGGLMAYGPSFTDLYGRAATYVDKILKGAKPADLPIEQPTNFELVVNLKVANALGLTIPPSVLFRADQVIQEAK